MPLRMLKSVVSTGKYFYGLAIAFFLIDPVQRWFGLDSFATLLTQYILDTSEAYFWVFLAAALETLFALSFYFPGSVVLFIVAVSVPLESNGMLIIFVWLGINFGTLVNYLIGRFSNRFVKILGHQIILQKTNALYTRYGYLLIPVFSLHPNYVGTLFLVLGISRIPAGRVFPIVIASTAVTVPVSIFVLRYFSEVVQTSKMSNFSGTDTIAAIFLIMGLIYGIWRSSHRN